MQPSHGTIAVAPMMDWTDRHCRYFHRLLSRRVWLYSEMITADAIIHGNRDRLLAFDPAEHPVAVQLGGGDPARLAQAAGIAAEFGYDEINLNIGCPSDRVQAGTFGACLMRDPGQVGRLVGAMKDKVSIPVTVKCRLGVDDQDIEVALDALADAVIRSGCDGLWVHARKTWLNGLSAKDNRNVPPLDYGRVERLKARLPDTFVGINGGIATMPDTRRHLATVDGVMIGRAACQHPELLTEVDGVLAGDNSPEGAEIPHKHHTNTDWPAVIANMADHAERHCAAGGRISSVVRPMIGLFAGRPGARRGGRSLTEEAIRAGAGPEVIRRAYAALGQGPAGIMEKPVLANTTELAGA